MTSDGIALAILAELKAMNALLRRRESADHALELVAEIGAYYGSGVFTTSGLLSDADRDGALAEALAAVLVDRPGRAVSLGRLLSRLADAGHLERLPDRGGVAMFRVVA